MSIKELDKFTIIFRLTFAFVSLFLFVNCTNESDINRTGYVASKNIILYIEGNNDLNSMSDSIVFALMHNSEIRSSSNSYLSIVYDDMDSTKIIDVTKGLIISYPKQNALDGKILRKLISKCVDSHPAKEYGIIFWSHGTGWIRTNDTRSFGYDNGKVINIDELSKYLPIKFDYLIFDACYMSCIEVVAEFKDKCQYIIASPEEVPSNGIIDTKSMSFLMSDSSLSNRLLFLCNNFKFKFLDYKKEVSLSLIKTDNIVTLMDEIKNHRPCKLNTDEVSSLNYYVFRNYKLFFDLKDVLDIDGFNDLKFDLKDLVPYKVYSGKVKKEGSGISIFLPLGNNSIYYSSYKGTYWNKYTNWLEKFY